MRKILFRVDASLQIGFGHLMRCICLARYISLKGADYLFILLASDQEAVTILKKENMAHAFICHEEEIIAQNKTDNKSIVVTDINNPVLFADTNSYQNYLSLLKQNNFYVISFEEFAAQEYPSDTIIIPYVGAESLIFPESDTLKYRLGSDYYIFRDEFIQAGKLVIKEKVEAVFLCMGGTDPQQLTEKLIGLLIESTFSFHLNIVFASIADKRKHAIENLLQSYQGSYQIFVNPESISSVMLASDIGIINSGLIKYETSMLGLPAITISNNAHHEEVMQLFAKKRSVIHLGPSATSGTSFNHELMSLVNNKEKRKMLSENGINLFDGKGLERVYAEVARFENLLPL